MNIGIRDLIVQKQTTLDSHFGTSSKTSQYNHTLKKVISGGQIGADRAGLEAAFKLGITTGGWAPMGFITYAGKDPELGSKFNLKELSGM